VADVVDNTVTELSGSSIVAHVPVGTEPGGQMAVDPSTHIAYAANEGSNTVSEISGSTVIATVPVGSEPSSVTVNPVTTSPT
jgi:serine/threonine protein kinase, bacterial